MSKFNGLAICTVAQMQASDTIKADKNGLLPVILTALAGKIPSKRIIAGTIAQSSGFVPGASYVVAFTEGEEDEQFGRQFQFTNGGRVGAMEILEFNKALGHGEIVEVMETKPNVPAVTPKANETKAPAAAGK
jgi:hypothetical protein